MTDCHYQPKCLTPSQTYSSALWFCSSSHQTGKASFCGSLSLGSTTWLVPAERMKHKWQRAPPELQQVLHVSMRPAELLPLPPIQPEFQTEHTYSRVTQMTDRSEARSKVAQVNVQINGYFKHWVLGQFGMQYYGGDTKTNTVTHSPTVFWRGSVKGSDYQGRFSLTPWIEIVSFTQLKRMIYVSQMIFNAYPFKLLH